MSASPPGARPVPEAVGAGAARSIRPPLARALLALTFSTGLVEAVSYLGLGRVFTANMTGNVVLLGFGLGGSHVVWIGGALVSLAFFLAGAVIGGRLTTRAAGSRSRALLGGLGLETALVGIATIVSLPA